MTPSLRAVTGVATPPSITGGTMSSTLVQVLKTLIILIGNYWAALPLPGLLSTSVSSRAWKVRARLVFHIKQG